MNGLPGCAAGMGGVKMRSGQRTGDRAAGTAGSGWTARHPHTPASPPELPALSGGGWWNLARCGRGLVGWGKHPWDAGEGVPWGKPELCAIYSFFCVVSGAAGIHGLIRGTNNDGTCDLSESFGYNYAERQVKESLLD